MSFFRRVGRKLSKFVRNEVAKPVAHFVRDKVTRPIGRKLGLSRSRNREEVQQEVQAANEEAAQQEQQAARELQDQKANTAAQQAIMSANQQAEEAILRAQKEAPVDKLDIVLGDQTGGEGFNFRSAARAAAGDTALFARKARAWFRR